MDGTAQRYEDGSTAEVDPRPVVVGVDGSPAGDEALAWAAGEAGRRGAPLLVVTAVGHHGAPPDTGMAGATASSRALDLARQVAEAGVARAREGCALPEEVEVGTEVHLAGAAAALLGASERAGLVVVGHRGRRPVVSALLGSVAFSVTARAECPVVVVRGDPGRTPGPGRPVVVGLDVDADDGSAGAGSPALLLAATTAHRCGAPLVVLAAVEPVEPLAGGYDQAFAEDMIAHARSRAGRSVDTACAAARRACPGLDVRAEVLQGRAGDALVSASAQAALVVVGARGLGRVPGLFLGSVSHEVVHRAGCPVAVARDGQG